MSSPFAQFDRPPAPAPGAVPATRHADPQMYVHTLADLRLGPHCYTLRVDWDGAAIGTPDQRYVATHQAGHGSDPDAVAETSAHALRSFAEAWLIERGCPADDLAIEDDATEPLPADRLTLRTEAAVHTDAPRCQILYQRTVDDHRAFTIVRDPQGGDRPVRVVFQTELPWKPGRDRTSFTLRRFDFATEDDAATWLSGYLAHPELGRDPRLSAALARSTTARPTLAPPPAPEPGSGPANGPQSGRRARPR
jgi:hypothetical protein